CNASCTTSNRVCPPGTECNASSGDCVPSQAHCGPNVCGMGEYCCNDSCGICAPLGGACTQQLCSACASTTPGQPMGGCPPGTQCDNNGHCVPVMGQTCGPTTCGTDQYCCNASCGVCAPIGGACPQVACASCGPNGATCPP